MSDPVTVRATPCYGCTFRRLMSVRELRVFHEGAVRMDACGMLCTESGSLDGSGEDVACRGWYDNLETVEF